MTTVAVLAILLGIAVPSFVDTIRNDRLAAEANELVISLTFARSEASKRGIQVTVCPRSGDACAADGSDWGTGWLVFTDDITPTGAPDAGDQLLMTTAGSGSGISISSDTASVTYTPTDVRTKSTFVVTKSGCKGRNKRQITVERTGRVSLLKQDC